MGSLLIYSADCFIDFGTKMRFTIGQKYLLLILLLKNSLCLPLIAFSNLKSLQIFFFLVPASIIVSQRFHSNLTPDQKPFSWIKMELYLF